MKRDRKSEAETRALLDAAAPIEDREARLAAARAGIPTRPGCYKYLSKSGKIIYVGKAKDLRKRVNSYFTKVHPDFKTHTLVNQIWDIEYVVTNTEQEALLLENNLIKEYQPRYNLMLKDGKSYPYIVVKNENYPRVFVTRKKIEDGSTYFGPYPSGVALGALKDFIRENFHIRTCTLNLTEANIRAGKFRPCLEYHIKKCKAPCVGYQDAEEYDKDVQQIKHLLRGHFGAVARYLMDEMQQAATRLEFERAAELKDRLTRVKEYREKATVVSEKLDDLEVITISSREQISIVNHFKVKNGSIVNTHAFTLEPKHQETPEEMMETVLNHIRAEDPTFADLVITNREMPDADLPEGIRIEVPKIGDKRKLVELSLKNCFELLREKTSVTRTNFWDDKHAKLMETMQRDLRLVHPPEHIECFDNSNIQGYEPVSSCVVFKGGKPSKKDYRHFRVKTVIGPDDFATMREIVHRRYRGVLERGEELPDLIVIDGGKGQLSHAIEALKELGLTKEIPIVGIAKRLEEIFYMNDPVPLYIDKKSPTLKIIQQIRNEAHRFAITYHRKRRDMATLRTELTEIPGIGEKLAVALLKEFGSVEGVRRAAPDALAGIIGIKKAEMLANWKWGEGAGKESAES